jgi:hypothetical protein
VVVIDMFGVILLGLAAFATVWSVLLFRDAWVERPIMIPDPQFPGRKVRSLDELPHRTTQGWWRHHHKVKRRG